MSEEAAFVKEFDVAPGVVMELSPLVRRIVVDNPGPYTFRGTNTYIVGRGEVAVIDPGPLDERHIGAILTATRGETISHVVVTHTHRDHSPGAAPLVAATGAKLVGCGPHQLARPLAEGEGANLDASADLDYAPDMVMREGDAVCGPGWTLVAIETPGHSANHLAFALPEENGLFSGDHVMGWSTTIVAPPEGSMSAYMASLEKLRGREDAVYWPGHGAPVHEPQRLVRGLMVHRRQRENAILARLKAGDETVDEIVPRLYEGLAPALVGAAGLSVFAHLEDLVNQGRVVTEGQPRLKGRYRLA
ncbi:MBL fold metallo-hydrolase [Camelimonas abortus]|uniref:MBL fold metallo-hydrolase n=1 Tax=Camelimonas abortus TaxID=1017184 RepID=A0ABV7LCY7_9HYPH